MYLHIINSCLISKIIQMYIKSIVSFIASRKTFSFISTRYVNRNDFND